MRKVVEVVPKTYWDDKDWIHAHTTELSYEYPDRWIAVADGKVVAAGKSLAKVEREAAKITGLKIRQISVFFIPGVDTIYGTD
jgi:hypothetical protein